MKRTRKTKPALWTTLPNAKIIRADGKRVNQRREYIRQKKQFLVGELCVVFPWNGKHPRTATQVHHVRGRLGKLLLDQMYWLPVSAEGHQWIHSHIQEARKMGYICAKGSWNKQP